MKNTLALSCALALGLWPVALSSAPSAQEPAQTQQTFEEFLAGVRAEALTLGISAATLDAALTGLTTPEPVVVARDRAQPEQTQSLDQYIAQRLSARTVTTAREKLGEHKPLLAKIETAYGVPAPLMVSIWGLESNFGRFTGTYPTIQALATLAYDNRRPLFRAELFHALAIIERGHITAAELKGSWAGAMGQPQFMPSSYLKHAVDFDGDNRADIWASEADVFGSMANYLKNAGWREKERWGREVKISRAVMARVDRAVPMRTTGCRALRELTSPRPLSEWKTLGVRLAGGAPLPAATLEASLVRGQRRHFLVYRNYEAIIDYNCSNAYAISVGLLADRIAPPASPH